MDAVWTPIGEAVLGPVLGEAAGEVRVASIGSDDAPNSTGSSFDGGWYGYVYKDLRTLLGEPVAQPYSRPYCGNGNLEACRDVAVGGDPDGGSKNSPAAQGPNPKTWQAAKVRIAFPPDPILHYTMRWTNRSTFQQVIEFTGHEEEAR